MNEEKQIEEMAWGMCDIPKHPSIKSCAECNCYGKCQAMYYAKRSYNAGYHKQNEEYKKRIINQREELHRLNKRIFDLIQSREAWKKKAERVGKQLHEALSKQSEGEWEKKTLFCPNCGAKMKGE